MPVLPENTTASIMSAGVEPGDRGLTGIRAGERPEQSSLVESSVRPVFVTSGRPLLACHAGQELRRVRWRLHREVVAAQIDEHDVEPVTVAVDGFLGDEVRIANTVIGCFVSRSAASMSQRTRPSMERSPAG
ncbi:MULTISPECIES: hypothetical protein [Nonomuraea]|uniref:Uncharacterized protein n=1 Tax=Nonomuraea salmonea TaxID=46181 RepID=A0ABV5NFZ4_9ACTN